MKRRKRIFVMPLQYWMRKTYKVPSEIENGGFFVVSTVAKHSEMSPFRLGPVALYDGLESKNMENAWQYAKVYKSFAGRNGPKKCYYQWAKEGWSNPEAVRYPMGKGVKPEYSWWDYKMLSYVEARKSIYVPLYAKLVQKTESFCNLKRRWEESSENLVLLDYDAYNRHETSKTLTEVLNDPTRKMGHAFVIEMLLLNDKALKECKFH